MSANPNGNPLESFLRLQACPNCDYSLQTLPLQGICPECGRSYDQQFAVLTGIGRGANSNLGDWRGTIRHAALLAFLAWIMFSAQWSWQKTAFGAVAAFALATHLYARLFSSRDPTMQLWISPRGIVQLSSTPEARQAQRVFAIVEAFFPAVVIIPIFLEMRFHPWAIVVMTAILLICIASALRTFRRYRNYVAFEKPGLWSWKSVDRIKVQELPGERASIRCRVTRYWRRVAITTDWIVDIVVACPAGIADQLEKQMLAWRAAESGLSSTK
jgi:hypothetical protein